SRTRTIDRHPRASGDPVTFLRPAVAAPGTPTGAAWTRCTCRRQDAPSHGAHASAIMRAHPHREHGHEPGSHAGLRQARTAHCAGRVDPAARHLEAEERPRPDRGHGGRAWIAVVLRL